ncbi:MAG: ABC transporter ATP-binding protein [Bacteroidia bacterium]|nr:ABC transporter ATP-binding protein [Bacteroidia bacterium]MBP9688009.1 ABC transporter ATP-binding protein [Bacteroidia bacterium]
MKSLKHLNKYFYKYRYRLILGMLFVIISNLFSAFPAKAVGLAIDLLVENLSVYKLFTTSTLQNLIAQNVGKTVALFTILIIVFALLRGFFMFLMRQSIIVMSRLVEFDLKNEVFNHYQKLSPSFYRKNTTGDLMARISEDVGRVRMYIGPAVMYFTNLIATFLVVIPIMFAVHAELALYVLLPLPILSYAIFKVNNIINKRSDAIQSQLSIVTGIAQETFSGIRVIKAFGAETDFRTKFEEEALEYKKRSLSLAKVDATFFPLMLFLTGMSTLITVFLGGMFVLRGEITIGNITEFVIYVNLLTWPVASLGWTSSLVQRAAASQERLNEFLQTSPEIVNPSTQPFTFNSSIEFKNVSFCYEGKTAYALKNINITLPKGQTLAILGTTGSGKSTLVQLLLRIMDVNNGEILIDGNNIKEINLTEYKQQIGYAPQDVFLFSDTIANNVSFGLTGNETGLKNRVEWAVKQAALEASIEGFKLGLDTEIGERGVTLSGGQKQRVSIARALIKNPDLLILDDCLSAVDTKTEAEILANLKQIMQNKTAIIISHRVSTVKDAHQILVLDDGQIIEQGNHTDLLALNGSYAELYQSQMID